MSAWRLSLLPAMTKTPILSVPAKGEQLAAIGRFVSAAALEAGLGERKAYHVQTAVDEACANIIYHAFDPASVPEPDVTADLEERVEGGLGRYLMRKLMDDVRHDFRRDGNVLTMVKHVGSR
jgi:serine/threonine-protein kinase RsbW